MGHSPSLLFSNDSFSISHTRLLWENKLLFLGKQPRQLTAIMANRPVNARTRNNSSQISAPISYLAPILVTCLSAMFPVSNYWKHLQMAPRPGDIPCFPLETDLCGLRVFRAMYSYPSPPPISVFSTDFPYYSSLSTYPLELKL